MSEDYKLKNVGTVALTIGAIVFLLGIGGLFFFL